jgi:hypothetical protein
VTAHQLPLQRTLAGATHSGNDNRVRAPQGDGSGEFPFDFGQAPAGAAAVRTVMYLLIAQFMLSQYTMRSERAAQAHGARHEGD